MDVAYADPVVFVFIAIPVCLALALTWATWLAWGRSGASREATMRATLAVGTISVVWMALTWAVADAGVLLNFDANPPPLAFLILGIFLLSGAIAFSKLGMRLARFIPLWMLVAVQGFRLPLELAMHAMYERGIMPREMSYSGRNFDIVTGASAIVVATVVWGGWGGRALVAAWNGLGLMLLLNVVIVAILATPQFGYFGDDRLNTWVMYPPFVWLPAVKTSIPAGRRCSSRCTARRRSSPARTSRTRSARSRRRH